MIRGAVIFLLLVLTFSAGAEMHSTAPDSAVHNTWNAVLIGSPQEFLATLEGGCSARLLMICDDYLRIMLTMSFEELGMTFARMRLEAAPSEIEYWDNIAVLEMILSAPSQVFILEQSIMVIDSLQIEDSTCIAFVSLEGSGIGNALLEIPVVSTTAGWQVTGIDPILSNILESIFTR